MISSPPPGSGISFFPGVQKKKGTPGPTLGSSTKRWSTSRLFKSFRGALKLSLFFLSIRDATNFCPPKSSSYWLYSSCSFHHFKIWTKHLIEKCKAYRKTMQKRKYVGLLEERHTRNLIWFFLCVASSSSSFAETSLDRLCSFSNSWRRFCNACHGQTMVPWRFWCLLGCLDVCLSHGG